MKTIFYKKHGRRYVPVSEYDNELLDALPKGDHLVSVYPGGSSCRFSIDPALAPMIAAGRYAEKAMIDAIHEASKLRPAKNPLTDEQRTAWRNLIKSLGEEATMLTGAAPFDIAQAGIQAMQAEAEKMLSNPAVRKAYDRFLIVAELARKEQQ